MKKSSMFLIVALMFILSSLAVSATVSIELPATSTIINDVGLLVYLNETRWDNVQNFTFCNISLNSALTNTTALLVNVTTNSTGKHVGNFTFTLNTNAFEDANDYNISILCTNVTGTAKTYSISSMTIDNTFPAVPTGLTSTEQTTGSPTLTSTVGAATTTSCDMVFVGANPQAGQEPTGTHATTTCTFALTNAPDYAYQWQVRASDGTNTTISEIAQFSIKTAPGKSNYVPTSLVGGGGGTPSESQPSEGILSRTGSAIGGFFSGIISTIMGWFGR